MLAGFLPSTPQVISYPSVCVFLLSLKQIFIVLDKYKYHTAQLHSCRQSEGTCQRAVALVSFCLTSGDEKRKLLSPIPEPPLASFPGVWSLSQQPYVTPEGQTDRQST